MNNEVVNIIGGGLAGCEAANFLASNGVKVNLYEKRPLVPSPAHHSGLLAELVCSNSLKSNKLDNACGLLKEEMRILGSLTMEAASVCRIQGGDSLDVDREKFAQYIDNKIRNNPNIEVINKEITELDLNSITIVATGPLTSNDLMENLNKLIGEKCFSFFDASSPIIRKDSIDFESAFYKSRYDHGEGDYINCPMNREEYISFYNELINAKRAPLHDFDTKYFEGCLPIEVIASRGKDTLRYGPLKPVGLSNNGEDFYAVVQLRQDNLIGDLYNMVGFQTNLTYGEQKRVFSMIPALKNAKFIRYGLMHRNTYIYSPKVLDDELRLKKYQNIYVAGQLSGVEGYVESAATGLLSAYYLYMNMRNIEHKKLSFYSILGALTNYITHTGINNFQPMNANFGIVYKANKDKKDVVINRALEKTIEFKKQIHE